MNKFKNINMDIKDNQIILLKEDLECVHLYLDDKEVPRQDDKGETYSIVGRIKQLENRMIKESSDLETEYLRK
jgi:hypothetical protein